MDSALVDLFGDSDDDNTFKKLPPEIEEGNIEYKVCIYKILFEC
jgi:hypothetical protein